MYTFDSRVRYSETDENGNLSLESLIDYMQDCTNFQSEDLGVGLEYHRQKNIMWVLNFWQIVIDEYRWVRILRWGRRLLALKRCLAIVIFW